jgi:hypothetical protein
MIELKTALETQGYDYVVCEVSNCEEKAIKVFMIQARYIELCNHHHEDMTNISYIS